LSLEKAFGVALKKTREKQKLTQLKLAERSDLDVTYISLLERGRRQPSLKAFIALAGALGVPAVDLLKKTLKELSSTR
jgi:transcriptional regulator with XRE-family HTH domain